jgi:hypothetical protein
MTVIYGDIGDPDTKVLENLWKGFSPKVLHAFKDTQEDINDAIRKEKDILILCGHGSPSGLFGDKGYAVGFHNVGLIKAKYVIGMWCHAKEFAKSAHLEGFFTAMYISNRSEALFNLKEEVTVSSAEITADIFQKSNALKWSLDREQFKTMFNLSEINTEYKNVKAYNYLIGRAQYDLRKFLYDPQTNYVLILNLVDDRIIGLQMRSLNKYTPKDKRFLTFNLERIYSKMLKSEEKVPDELNTVSTIFNIYSVNVYNPIIVTEGPMDAFLLPNAVATSGANKALNIELPFWYLYDSDKTGIKHAMEKIQEKKMTFLWGKLKTDLGLPKRDKWDVNDVVLWCNQNKPGYKIEWVKYFSNDPLDMLYLDNVGGLF